MSSNNLVDRIAIAASCFVWTILAALPATSATLFVDTTAPDVLATNGVCSLREAVINTNADAATWPDCPAGSGPDLISVSPGSFTVGDLGALFVAGSLTIQGAGADQTILDGDYATHILEVDASGDAELVGLAVVHGYRGIAIRSSGLLTLLRAQVSDTGMAGCHIYHGCGSGAAVLVEGGAASVLDSAIVRNTWAPVVANPGDLLIENSTVADNGWWPTLPHVVILAIGSLTLRHATVTSPASILGYSMISESSVVSTLR